MSVDLVKMVLENVCLLMTSHTREIVASALSFIKMFLTSFSYDTVAPEVSLIVSIFKFIGNHECSGEQGSCSIFAPDERLLKYHSLTSLNCFSIPPFSYIPFPPVIKPKVCCNSFMNRGLLFIVLI